MKTLFPSFVLFILFSTIIFAQTSTVDILYLKNGSIIRGQVMELSVTNVKIQTSDGSLFVYTLADVEKMVKETVAPAPSPIPTPTPAPTQTFTPNTGLRIAPNVGEVQQTLPPAPIPKKEGVSFALRGGLFVNVGIWNNLGKSTLLGLNGEPDSKIGFGLMGLLTAGIDIDEDMYLGAGPHLGGNFWRHSTTVAKQSVSVQINVLDVGADFAFGFTDIYFVFGTGSSTVSVTAEAGSSSQTVEIPDKAPYTRLQFGWSDGIGIGFTIASYSAPFENLSRIEFNIGFSL